MIGIEGQYLLSFSIGEEEDFIPQDFLESFKLIEQAGNILPMFELQFRTENENVFKHMNEGNALKLQMGKDRNTLKDSTLSIHSIEITRIGDSQRRININGLYSAVDWLSNPKVFISDEKTGMEAIEEVISKASNLRIKKDATNDSTKMKWIQPNITDREFINNIWMRSYIDGSFPLIAISSQGDYIVRDMKTLGTGDPAFKFTPSGEDNTIAYGGDFNISSNSQFMNLWVGYGRRKLLYNMEDGDTSIQEEDMEPILAVTSKLPRNSDIAQRTGRMGIINENLHEDYFKAELRNLQGLATFSAYKLTLTFSNRFEALKPLDLVYFKDNSTKQEQGSVEYYSGNWVVSKIARNIASGVYTTVVEMDREGLNSMKGDLR